MPEKKKRTTTKTKTAGTAKPAKARRQTVAPKSKLSAAKKSSSNSIGSTLAAVGIAQAPSNQPQEQTAPSKHVRVWSTPKLLLLSFGLAILITLGFLLLTGVVVGGFFYQKAHQFSTEAGISLPELRATIERGLERTVTTTNGRKNLLLLGTDELDTRGDAPVLTDTIMFVSLDTTTGAVTTLALPRDIWSDEYQTKINALYLYGKERSPEQPELFPTQVFSDWTGIPIHHTIVVSLASVSELIDTLGGVEVTIPESFTDELFPRTDVDVTVERDPRKLYKTVSFTAGIEKMNGERALEYMRSRHSGGSTGTDTSRSQRQAAVIMAVLQSVRRPEVILNPKTAGQLYRYYTKHFANVFPPEEAVATLKVLWPHRAKITVQAQQLSIFPQDSEGIIFHPTANERTNWIYRIRKPETFASDIQSLLYAPPASSAAELSSTPSAERSNGQ